MRSWLTAALLALAALAAAPASAHEMSMAEMEIRQVSNTDFVWQWGPSEKGPVSADLTPAWPEGCAGEDNVLHCGPQGLSGTLSVDGVGKRRFSAAMVKIHWQDGETRVYALTSSQPTARLYGSSEDRRSAFEVASAYTMLGIEHILTGVDHLAFVLALLFLVGFNKRLLWTITAFTAAHSLTLALSALGLLTLRPPPVEATIALSIVLVAKEALGTEGTLSRRWPALVAFLFGLMHGLGFAGALKEIGLPQGHLATALLTFNVGVELGQLFVLGLAFALYRLLSNRPWIRVMRAPALYVIGSVAAFWSIERIAAIVS